jgi:uncharacterized protein YyaL (SSP411 family)
MPSSGMGDPRAAACPPPNRLSGEKSPYLLQHATNPVDWRPWGEEAFAEAARQDKPIFLSIGYSTCHCATSWPMNRSKTPPWPP